jgi:NTP pyrophosphatase (non-canonical NTP hydrolase)
MQNYSAYAYVACPYSSLDPATMEARYQAALRFVCLYTQRGHTVYSPIVHNHHVALAYEQAAPEGNHRDWAFWEKHDLALLSHASELLVLQLPGWDKSVGVKAEVDHAIANGIPVEYVPWLLGRTDMVEKSAQYDTANCAQFDLPKPAQKEHSALVGRLVKDGYEILATLTANAVDLWHGATGVCTEAGELLDAVKKHVIYNKHLDYDNVVEELGDIEFYLEQIRQNLGIDRDETLRANLRKLNTRYPTGSYSNKAAISRADKDGE